VISRERLKIKVKLLLSANRKSYVRPMTLSDLELPFQESRAISAVVELFVSNTDRARNICWFISLLWVTVWQMANVAFSLPPFPSSQPMFFPIFTELQ